MAAADCHQLGQVQLAFAFRQFVQGQYQRGVAEEGRGLGDFFRQLRVEALQVVVRQFHHGDGEHAALELEYGILGKEVGLAHGDAMGLLASRKMPGLITT